MLCCASLAYAVLRRAVPCYAALQALLTPATVVPANLPSIAGILSCPPGTVIVGFRLITISLSTQGISLQRYVEIGQMCK